jgi:multidrug efflux pump
VISRIFIDRPIFAWVIAILIMLTGTMALYALPVAQYPDLAATGISIQCTYPGASAKTVEDAVTQVIEQKLKGIDNMTYMYSTSDIMGQSIITLMFASGTDPDIAQVQVQNKLALAAPLLPEAVQRTGISVTKTVRNYLVVICFVDENKKMTDGEINDYVLSNLQEPLSRVSGVGDLIPYGAQYAMRIWLDPTKFEQYRLSVNDVTAAVNKQNAQIPGGHIGGRPAVSGQQISMTVNAMSRLTTVEQFENIMLRVNRDGSILYLKDVARIELNSENFFSMARYNGLPTAGLAIKLTAGANAIDTTAAVKKEIENLSAFFPQGMKVYYPYDTAPFVRISINKVYKTLLEAITLVFIVMFLFLQNFRATLIPTIAIPVVILGTFAILAAFGYSINTMTMFGMVLTIGLLVDDAIVVVENVERVMHEEHLPPKEATGKSMDQITGALVGIAVVLSAVFIPMVFFGGSVGVIYRQFSITIVSSMMLSVLVALVLTPALCTTMLQHRKEKSAAQAGFFGWFNRWFDKVTFRYQEQVRSQVQRPAKYVVIYIMAMVLMAFMFLRLPSAFLPDEDQGIMFVQIELPPGASMERNVEVVERVEEYFLNHEKETVEGMMAVAGSSFSGLGQNVTLIFIRLRDWSERPNPEQKIPALQARSTAYLSQIQEAGIFTFAPPAVMEMGDASGFDFELIDRGAKGRDALTAAQKQLVAAARRHPELRNVRANSLDDVEEYTLDIDLAKAAALGVDIGELNSTISAFWGSLYVNDFMDGGRVKKVYMQADASFRMQEKDFNLYHVRNENGEMVPFSSILTGHPSCGSPKLQRYNGRPAAEILGEPAPGSSTGNAMLIMETLVKELPSGFGYSWTGLSYQERLSGGQAPALYAVSLLVVFLCLAALYESWSIPFSVMLTVPFGVIGALVGAHLRGFHNDVYFQVSLLTTVGLSAKNAILIVEFARDLVEKQGMDIMEAVVQAVRLRVRPIIMTSFAFILGVLTLAVNTGAGSGGQNAIGTAVMAGMLMATFCCLYYTPIFFVMIQRAFAAKQEITYPELPYE